MGKKKLYVKFFDVGLGDCILVSSGGKLLLIDGGSWYTDSLKLFIRNNSVKYIDYIICTHAHEDHVDGLADILSDVDFGVVYSNIADFPKSASFSKIKSIVEKNHKSIIVPQIGDTFYVGECQVSFLSPGCHQELVSGNDRSLTCMLECMGKKILMAADVGKKVFEMWEKEDISISADVFKVPHHGLEFIEDKYIKKISPKYSIISYGLNDYDVLNQKLIDGLKAIGTDVFNTYSGGDIECYVDGESNLSIKYTEDTIAGKKLLLLAANEETKKFVDKAHELGVKVFVTDQIIGSPAKSVADEYYDINGKDTALIVKKIEKDKIDGILVGVADPLVNSYLTIAEQLRFPCYVSSENIGFFTDKSVFKRVCRENSLDTVEEFYIGKDSAEALRKTKEFPCIMKPSKGRGGKGVSLCISETEFERKFEDAKKYADDEVVIVEKYMSCNDIIANYYFVNGRAYLIAVSDRETIKSRESISPVTYANIYPSKVTEIFIEKCDSKFKKLFKNLNINNGILEMQIFWDGKDFYPYDPACILGGELSGPIFSKVLGIDLIGSFIKYALTGNMHYEEVHIDCGRVPNNKYAQSIWILLKSGQVGKVCGIDEVRKIPGVLGCLQRMREGDIVTDEMFETEKSAIVRVWIVEDSFLQLKEKERQIRECIVVYDSNGNDMVWNGECEYE